MSPHLSAQQVFAMVSGERSPDQERHVMHCPECRAEVAHLQEALMGFRGSMRLWSHQQLVSAHLDPIVTTAHPARLSLRTAFCVCLAMAALILFGVLLRPHRQLVAASQALTLDTVLLNEVDAALSRDVPSSMEPLTKLLHWENSTETGAMPKQLEAQ